MHRILPIFPAPRRPEGRGSALGRELLGHPLDDPGALPGPGNQFPRRGRAGKGQSELAPERPDTKQWKPAPHCEDGKVPGRPLERPGFETPCAKRKPVPDAPANGQAP